MSALRWRRTVSPGGVVRYEPADRAPYVVVESGHEGWRVRLYVGPHAGLTGGREYESMPHERALSLADAKVEAERLLAEADGRGHDTRAPAAGEAPTDRIAPEPITGDKIVTIADKVTVTRADLGQPEPTTHEQDRGALLARDLRAAVVDLLTRAQEVRRLADDRDVALDSLDRADATRALTSAIGSLRGAAHVLGHREEAPGT